MKIKFFLKLFTFLLIIPFAVILTIMAAVILTPVIILIFTMQALERVINES